MFCDVIVDVSVSCHVDHVMHISDLDTFLSFCDHSVTPSLLLQLEVLGLRNPDRITFQTLSYVARSMGIIQLLRTIATDASRGHVYIPTSYLKAYDVTVEDILFDKKRDAVKAIVRDLSQLAEDYLSKARVNRSQIEKQALPVLLPAVS